MKLLSVAAVLARTASAAHADSRSWAAVKGMLPDNVNVVAGANLAALRGTSIYQTVVPQLLAKDRDAQRAFDLAKSTCSIDLHGAIIDVTFAMADDERGVLVAAIDKSLDQKRMLDCATKVLLSQNTAPIEKEPVATEPPRTGGLKAGTKKSTPAPIAKAPAAPAPAPKIISKTTGKITEYGIEGDPKRFYIAWLAPDVLAVATDADDKALLDKMLAGKGAKGTLGTYLGKASSNAAIWLASTKAQSIQQGVNMKGAFGTIDTTKGNVSFDMSLVLADAKEAKGFVEHVKALVGSMKGQIPPQFVKLVDALKLSAAADAANFKLVASEKDIMSVLALALSGL